MEIKIDLEVAEDEFNYPIAEIIRHEIELAVKREVRKEVETQLQQEHSKVTHAVAHHIRKIDWEEQVDKIQSEVYQQADSS